MLDTEKTSDITQTIANSEFPRSDIITHTSVMGYGLCGDEL